MHGPEEVAFADELFDRVEDVLGLPRYTLKMGIMDEERRTTVNLKACIRAARHRVVLYQYGLPGPHRRRDPHLDGGRADDPQGRDAGDALDQGLRGPERRHRPRLRAARARRRSARACGPMPDRMADMMAQKIAHPQAGANTAWVPSPTAATLHALHYHQVDVAERQARAASRRAAPSLDEMLTHPGGRPPNWSPRGHPAGARQQRPGHPRLRGALDRSGRSAAPRCPTSTTSA